MAKRRNSSQAGDAPPNLPAVIEPKPDSKLKPEHQQFCLCYVRYNNATVAYHMTYPEASYGTCRSSSSELMAKPTIREFIQLLRDSDAAKLNFSREDALRLLLSIAENPMHKQQREAINDVWTKFGFSTNTNPAVSADEQCRASEFLRQRSG